MDDRGRIYDNVSAEEAKAKNLIPIPKEEEDSVRAMNRHQRRAWAAQQRRKQATKCHA